MHIAKRIILGFLLIAGVGYTQAHEADANDNKISTERLYQELVAGNPKSSTLNLFMTQMPKGGDIHHHYSGAQYVETYLDWVALKGWWIDSCTLQILQSPTPSSSSCTSMTVPELIKDNSKYRKLLSVWSDEDFSTHFHDEPPPDSNFFNTFGYFGKISSTQSVAGMNLLKQRAVAEHVSYIETMYAPVGFKASVLYQPDQITAINTALRAAHSDDDIKKILKPIAASLDVSPDFLNVLSSYVQELTTAHDGIDDDRFIMRYQTYAARTQEPLQVFIDLYSGYRATFISKLIVGVNIVAPENNHVSLTDYTLHMQMFKFLNENMHASKTAPHQHVNLALHAGELTLGMVTPEDLQFHINQARSIAHANRIGHGVDISYEHDPVELLKDIKANHVAVEINLTSNEFILGVKGNDHPYLIYSAFGVPLIISTDDAGVSRNNLSNQFLLLATRYAPTYDKIKEYVYNSIDYSFLDENDKLLARHQLDSQFEVFERKMAAFHKELTH